MLVAAGTGGTRARSLDGYKLLADSPCIAAGRMIEAAGPHDFWQTPLPTEGNPNIGADATRHVR